MKYKILHILTRAMSSGGAEKNIFFVVKCLNKGKYQVHLAIGSDSEEIPGDLDIPIFKIKHLKRKISLFSDISAFWTIYRLIKKNKYQIVHTHQSKAGFLGRLAAKLAGAPVIIHTVHAPLFYENQNFLAKIFCRFLEKFLAHFTNWFVAVGEEIREYYLKNKVGEKEKFAVIRSEIDLQKFKNSSDFEKSEIKFALKLPKNAPVVGMVGRLEKIKGFEEAIKVARLILQDKPETKFIFAGKGNYEEALKEKSADLAGKIIFAGFRRDIEKIMDIFDVLISTSPKEGVSQSLIQGALLGKPIVCFKTMGATEIVKDNGFIAEYKNLREMAEKIRFLLDNPKTARAMGEKGKRLAEKKWHPAAIKAKNIEFYEDLLKNYENRF